MTEFLQLVISGLRAGTTETLTQTVTLSADYIQRVSP